jgi:hypothetical protein
MADDQHYSTDALGEEEASRLLRKILSPAEAQSLVLPPPDHPPQSGPGESTPLTGNLADLKPKQTTPVRRGLAGYFATAPAQAPAAPDRSGDPTYIKVSSKGQVGYLPKANLHAARQIDVDLKVLDEA